MPGFRHARTRPALAVWARCCPSAFRPQLAKRRMAVLQQLGSTSCHSFSVHSLNQKRARGSGLERVAELWGLTGHLTIQELHNANRIGRLAIIREDEFRDPQVVA